MSSLEIQNAVGSIQDPEIGRSLSDLKMIKSVEGNVGEAVTVHIELPTPAYPNPERIDESIKNKIKEQFGDETQVSVERTWVVKGANTGGAIGLRVKNVIAVGSGKGGVGKSTLASALAFGLKHYGATVGLLDADVYGPSIPHLLGVSGQPAVAQKQNPDGSMVERIQPVVSEEGMPLMSLGFMIPEDQAVIWRGPMLHKLLTQFLRDTDWGELDYLIIDMPPGTGDVSLTLSQMLGLAGSVVVCSPQKVALLDAVKAISMFRKVEIPVLGMVENMSGDVFGRGGAEAKAKEMGVPFLGEVPMESSIRISGDEGKIASLYDEGNPSREALLHITEQVAIGVAKNFLKSPAMPSLEIL